MAESTSPRGNSGDFAKKVQRQLSRGKEKVLQKLGKTEETRDDQFDYFQQIFIDQQADGSRIFKDLRNYINAVREMREASRRLSLSLFDVYENDWVGGEDLGAIVEGEDLLWNDYEVKVLDQVVRTMESYVNQFPDVKEKIAKRGRKLVDYDSTLHHVEALQTAKKRDDVKIHKAREEMKHAKSIYEGINTELKHELPVLFDSRIGCYVAVFSAMSNLREIFYKEMSTLNHDLQNVMKELQAQHPDTVFALKGMQRYGSLRRRTLMSPRAWKASFSEFHRSYNPKTGPRFSLRSPDKPRRSTLSRESSTPTLPSSVSRDTDSESSYSEAQGSFALEDNAAGATRSEGKSGGNDNKVEEENVVKVSESEPPPESDDKGNGPRARASDSSSELNNSYESGSLDLQLSAAADNSPLHVAEREDSPVIPDSPKSNALENGEVSGFTTADTKDLEAPHKDALTPRDPKSTEV